MKFCSECGSQLPLRTAKFCPNCGTSLWQQITHMDELSVKSNQEQTKGGTPEQFKEYEVTAELQNQHIHSLGIKMEEIVQQILKYKGYLTDTRQKLIGQSGASHEIDILAKQGDILMAVECKNYAENRTVGIEELRDFYSKIQDLPQINSKMFVTNASFSSEARVYADYNNI